MNFVQKAALKIANISLDEYNHRFFSGDDVNEDSEIVTIIVGEEGSTEEAEKLEQALVEWNDELEVEIHQGDQPVYPYLFSAE